MSGRTIAFFGSSLVSAYWNGAATYYRGIIKELHLRGYRTTFYEPDAYERQAHRDIPDPEWARVVVYQAADESGAKRALDDAAGADIIIKASGVGVFDELLERGVLEARRRGAVAAFWDVDAPATLDRVKKDPRDPFAGLIGRYDLILTYGGGPPVVEAYKGLGARVCSPIYNALDPDTHYRVPPEKGFACDLGFIGNRLPDREARVREFFFRTAALLPGSRFMLGGNGWDDPMAPNIKYRGHVYTKDHNVFNSSALAVLNVNRESMARYGFSPPTRLFEAAGAAACIISDAWEGMELFLEPGKEVLQAGDAREVAGHLESLTEKRSGEIGRAALKRIAAEHTYAHRAAEVDGIFKFFFE